MFFPNRPQKGKAHLEIPMGFARFRKIPGYLVTPGGVEPPLQDRKSWVLDRWTMEPRNSLLQKNIIVARPVRLERTTYRFEVWRSIQLSYGREVQIYDFPKNLSSGFQISARISSEVFPQGLHGDFDDSRERYGQDHPQNAHKLTSDQHHDHNGQGVQPDTP